MRKVLLMCLLLGNCITWARVDYPLKSKPEIYKKVDSQIQVVDPEDERRWNSYKVFMNEQLFKENNSSNIEIQIDCNRYKKTLHGFDLALLFAFGLSAGIIPLYISEDTSATITTLYKRRLMKAYSYTNTEYHVGSILLLPMLLFYKRDKQFENFLVNTGREIHLSIESDIAQIEKQEQEEKEAAAKIEDQKKLAEEMKLKEEKEKADAEYREELAKIKSLKPTILPIGALYCKQEMYAVGISMGATTQETIMALLSIKECAQVEDKPIKAKVVPSQSQYATVYVYINDEKFYSTKKMLRSR